MAVQDASRREFLRWLAWGGVGLAAAGIPPALFAQEAAASGVDVVVVLGATLIDGTNTPPHHNSAVVLVGDRIAWVGPASGLPSVAGALVVDGRGKYLIPGLFDMHTHGLETEELFPPLHVVNGVTGIREMWGTPENRATRAKIERGALTGPRSVMASSILDGPVSLLPTPVTKLGTEEEARAAVRAAKAEGADFVKVYFYLPANVFGAIADECRVQGLPFAGHWPYRVDQVEAARAGQRSFEHLFGLPTYTSSRRDEILGKLAAKPFDAAAPRDFFNFARELDRQATLAYSPANASAHFGRLKENGSGLTPTLVINRVFSRPPDTYADDPRLKYMSPEIHTFWAERVRLFTPTTPEQVAQQAAYLNAQLELVGAAHRAGVSLTGGTDCLNPYVFPGFGLHDELELLVSAGLSELAALQAVTRDAACFLGRSQVAGTVSAGKEADLVLLDANPLADINAVRRIDTVITRGRVLDKATREAMLADVEKAANRPPASGAARSAALTAGMAGLQRGCC